MADYLSRPRATRTATADKRDAPRANLEAGDRLNARSEIRETMQRAAQLNRRTAPLQRVPSTLADGLPETLRTGLETLSGVALDDVKVHRNSAAPAQFRAYAFAQGSDIHLAPGQEHHLPHEAWHVVQQKQGRVRPTRHDARNQAINDSPALEQEADRMGTLAARPAGVIQAISTGESPRPQSPVRQAKVVYSGNFDPDAEEPDVDDYEDYLKLDAFKNAREGMELYQEGDRNVAAENKAVTPALQAFEGEPGLELIITTGPLEPMGLTTFAVKDDTDTFRGFEQGSPNAATADEWPEWMTAGNDIRITVTLRETLSKAEMVHTLNHEIALHASNKLTMIRKVRAMRHPTQATNFVDATVFGKGVYSPDSEHASLGADKNARLKATHAAIKKGSKDANFNESLDKQYASDVRDMCRNPMCRPNCDN
jgi:hypothetical protein